MGEFPKIHIDDLHVSLRPEELDSILGLRNTFDYFETLGTYVSSYLKLGWVVKLVIPDLDIALDVDFQQVREVWNQGLTDLAIKGLHTSLMVYTGKASNLLVMEVQGKNAEKALVFGRDWRARCVIQMSDEREQHFYTWPEKLIIPNQTPLESLDVQVFGEGGKVTLPPSLVPGVKDTIRWLVPPWESSPEPPTRRFMEFLEGYFLKEDHKILENEPEIPAWEEIYTQISSQAQLMQRLLTPAAEAEAYYRNLLQEARACGMKDNRFLLGLLWHAPMGPKCHDRGSLGWFQNLVEDKKLSHEVNSSQPLDHVANLINELSNTLKDLKKTKEKSISGSSMSPLPELSLPNQAGVENQCWPLNPGKYAVESGLEVIQPKTHESRGREEKSTVCFVHPTGHLPEEIPVNRKEYEAMIYELGRLGALQKFSKRFIRETDALKSKLETQRQQELEHLRQLVREKKNKGWW
jgi:hypothetical protein